MTDTLTLWLGERLVIGSIQAVVLVSLVWLTCRLFRRIPAAAQAALWWLVALKLVLVFAPMPAVPVPVLPADFGRYTERLFLQRAAIDGGDTTTSASRRKPQDLRGRESPKTDLDTVASALRRKAQTTDPINPVFQGLVLLWLVALLLQTARLVLAHRHLRAIVARSAPWPGEEMSALAARVGLKRTPQVRMSDAIDCPQVFGLWSPVVLLPATTMTALSADERTMTLCHELMHIRRRDLLWGWVPACAERLFFFHPLARLGAREYVAARESACDAAAVRALDVPAHDYGRMLVRLGIGDARPAVSVGGSPFSTSSLKRRLEMLDTRRLSNLSRRWRWAIAILAAVLIPLQLVARTPAAPEIRKPSFDVFQMLVGMWAKVQGKEVADPSDPQARLERFLNPWTPEQGVAQLGTPNDVELQIQAEKLKVEKLKAKIESELGKEVVLLVDTRESLLGTVEHAEQADGVQETADRARLEEMRALVAKLREATAKAQEADAQANADKAKLVEQLARRAQELEVARAQEEARRVERQAREVVRAPQVSQQQRLERLLAQLERLAAEQRRLLEEIRQLQQQPRE